MSGLRWVRFESAALGGVSCEVTGLDGEEELNRLFRCTARLTMPGLAGAEGLARELLGSPAALVFEDSGAEVTRLHGIAAEVQASVDATRDAARITVTLVPRAWLLSQTRRSEIFLDRSVPEILAERLAGAGLREDDDFVLALRGAYPAREHVGQYGESDLDFFCRLCEDLGLAFFYRHRRGRDVLVLTDTADAFEPIACPRPELQLRARREERGAFEITEALRRVPARALVHDNNHHFSEPDAEPLDATTSVGVLARKELRLKSGEECVLICAHKNVLATAHTGSMTLKAGKAATSWPAASS